ncbi:MAG: NAD(P)-binding domain-containing protein, partial [Methylococcaceae bacterium]|nr:NAD(P)-binding domain-containing protein [Methylococcaceae bacterium]
MNIQKIGFIGGGNMASSLISGLIASGHSPQHLWVSDINPDTLKALAENLNINTSASNDAVINEVDVIVLAVKPQTLSSVAKSVATLIQQKKSLVVSIAAGISQRSLSQWIGADV